MFDSFLGRKFYSKCKTSLKLIKIRLEKINKRRNSVQKFLRADIADLLKNNLDINAYGRAEGLLIEMNMSACYKMIEKFCECISANLVTIDKQNECPDECREAVSSLMYAAARFADLPELRDLRNLFSTKYGTALDSHISKEFADRLKLKPSTKEMKFQLLQEIADEVSTAWDSKALEQKLYTPSSAEHYRPEYGSFDEEDVTEDVQTQQQLKPEEEIIIDDHRGSEKRDARHYGLVPPPPYYTKKGEPTPAGSSDTETFDMNDEQKPKAKSVRKNRFNQKQNVETEVVNGEITRGVSLPHEQMMSPRTMQGPTRAASFETDGMKGLIHPKLPNYDDLASRIATLSGR